MDDIFYTCLLQLNCMIPSWTVLVNARFIPIQIFISAGLDEWFQYVLCYACAKDWADPDGVRARDRE